ncbi:hypothetical protein EIZ97_23385, partial [Escherichia coli]|nr:hypothetical protein [Escherichia coli]
KRAYCLKTQPATGETYPKSDLFNKAGSASPTPFPAKLYPLKTAQMPLYAVGVVPARRQPQSGRISALAGR